MSHHHDGHRPGRVVRPATLGRTCSSGPSSHAPRGEIQGFPWPSSILENSCSMGENCAVGRALWAAESSFLRSLLSRGACCLNERMVRRRRSETPAWISSSARATVSSSTSRCVHLARWTSLRPADASFFSSRVLLLPSVSPSKGWGRGAGGFGHASSLDVCAACPTNTCVSGPQTTAVAIHIFHKYCQFKSMEQVPESQVTIGMGNACEGFMVPFRGALSSFFSFVTECAMRYSASEQVKLTLATCLFLAAKSEESSRRLRDVINVTHRLSWAPSRKRRRKVRVKLSTLYPIDGA